MQVRYFAALGLCAASSGCSLLTHTSQCDSDKDCLEKGSRFANTVCSAGLCVDKKEDDASTPFDECARNAECEAQRGEGFVCVVGASRHCERLLSEDCSRSLGPANAENAFLLGMLIDFADSRADETLSAVDLALNDFKQGLAGIPRGPGRPARALAMVVCDEQSDVLRGARHLVEDLGVPAIVGPSLGENLITLAQKLTVDAGVVLLSSKASSQAITELADQGLVFRTTSSDFVAGKVLGLVTSLLAANAGRVIAITTQDALGRGLTQGLESSLSVQGRSVAEAEKDGSYAPLSLKSAPSASEREQLVATVVAHTPQTIVFATGAHAASLMMEIEAALPISQTPPSYIVADSGDDEALMQVLAEATDTLLARIRVVYPSNDESVVFEAFRRNFSADVAGTPHLFEGAKAYDAVYVLGLAAIASFAAHPGTAAGRDLATAIAGVLRRGDPVEARVSSLPYMARRLAVGSFLDLEGASGPLDFDLNGDVETDFAVACLKRTGRGIVRVASELRYRAARSESAGVLTGSLTSCLTGP